MLLVFRGEISNDISKPDGMPLKRLDVSLADELGWRAKIPLEEGIQSAYDDFCRGLAGNTVDFSYLFELLTEVSIFIG